MSVARSSRLALWCRSRLVSGTDTSGFLADGGVRKSFSDAGQDLTYAVTNSLNQILHGGIKGGDVYIKRAVQAFLNAAQPTPGGPVSGDLSALTGDISIAQNYEEYADNTATINALIAASHEQRVRGRLAGHLAGGPTRSELDQRAASDWTGGWGAYLAGLNADPEQLDQHRSSWSNARLPVTVGTITIADTDRVQRGKDIITDTKANDTISISATGVLQADLNALFDGTAATTAQTPEHRRG